MFENDRNETPTRDRLVMTAADLLMRQSFGAVSVDDICRAADVKKGTFYHHFPSKVDLALAAYDYKWNEARAKFDQCFDPAQSPQAQLEAFCEAVYEHHAHHFKAEGKVYGCPLASASSEMGTQDDRIHECIKRFFDLKTEYFKTFIEKLPHHAHLDDAAGLASEMVSYVMGVVSHAKLANDLEIIRRDMLPGLKRLTGI
jgi:TetR/AcrR family transcriptional repressor of nem operon